MYRYEPDEVKQLVEVHRDGESLSEVEERMAKVFIQICREAGKDPLNELKRFVGSSIGTDRD